MSVPRATRCVRSFTCGRKDGLQSVHNVIDAALVREQDSAVWLEAAELRNVAEIDGSGGKVRRQGPVSVSIRSVTIAATIFPI